MSSIEAVLEFTEGVTFESVARTEATSTTLPVVVMDESSTKSLLTDIRGQLTEEGGSDVVVGSCGRNHEEDAYLGI